MGTDLWTYREGIVGTTGTSDLEGFDVEARDGSIGKIDEATNTSGRSTVVVDTGPWIFGRKVVIPAGTIEQIDLENRKVVVSLTKDQIKESPEFDPERGYDDEEYRANLAAYYDRYVL